MDEEKFAEMLLFQTKEVYPHLYKEYSRMKSLSVENKVSLRQVKNRLIYVEEQERNERGDARREVQMNIVEHRQNIRQVTTQERRETLQEAMRRSPCRICNQYGHWMRDCPRSMRKQTWTRQ